MGYADFCEPTVKKDIWLKDAALGLLQGKRWPKDLKVPDDYDERERAGMILIGPAFTPVVRWFSACLNQIVSVGMGSPIGIDYIAAETTARMMGIKVTAEMFEDFRTMESVAVNYWAQRAKAAQEAAKKK